MPRDVGKEFPIEEVLATSDRNTVYRSIDGRTGEVVVVKLLASLGPSETQAQRHRFLRTIEALRSHSLRSFPEVLVHGFSSDGRPFIVTRIVEGKPVSELEGSSPARITKFLATVADSLEAASRKGVSHHNLNPENILVVDQNGVDEAFFLGIGTAAYFDRGAAVVQPTPPPDVQRFIAPELLDPTTESGPADWRSDLYSFALIAVTLLGGRVAGEGGDEPLVSFPDSIQNYLDDPEGVTQVLGVALRGDPRQRSIGWADLHRVLRTKDIEEAGVEPDVPSLDATIRIPLDRLPNLDTLVGETDKEIETDTYRVVHPPVAVGDFYETQKNISLKVAAPGVLSNDSDTEGHSLSAVLLAEPAHGSLDLQKDGSFVYIPESGFDGDDGFTYKANNGFRNSNVASVSIVVRSVVHPPKAVDASFSTDEGLTLEIPAPGVLGSAADEDGQQLKAIAVTQPTHGSLNLRADGSFSYRPDPAFVGTDFFGYRISNQEMASGVATVTINVSEIDQPSATNNDVSPGDESREPQSPPVPPKHAIPIANTDQSDPPKAENSTEAFTPPPVPPPVRQTEFELVPPPLPKPQPANFSWPPSGQWIYLLGGAGLVLIVIIGIVALWPNPTAEIQHQVGPTVVVPTEVPTPMPAPTEPPQVSFHPRLDAAESALIAGETDAARAELDALTEQEIDLFTEEEAGFYDHLLSAIEGGQLEEAIQDLRGGLSWSSIKMIRRGMAGLSTISQDELASEPGLTADIQRGQTALQFYTRMDRARKAGDNALLLEHSTAMIGLLPEYGTAHEWREEAVSSLEVDAQALADDGQLVRAIAALEPVSRWWPEREGLQDRLNRYRSLQDENIRRQGELSDFEEFLTAAIAKGEAGDPEEGLRMLARRKAPESLGQRKRDAISGLEAQLAQMDASPPEIVLAPGTEFTYRKNEPFQISVRISDDHRIVTAIAKLRGESTSQYREIPLAGPIGDSYTLTVGADLHGNGVVQLYFEARDVSGHVGFLGSTSEPIEVKRKGFFDRIRRK